MINNQRPKNIRNLVAITSMIALILSVATYAWFVGTRTVNISSFDVEIVSTDGLLLSLNGSDWDTTLSISKATLDTLSYTGHTNNWGGAGLVPVSSIGQMDIAKSRMRLFEKASLNPTPGGYRLMASRIDNYGPSSPERDGYVVFDLFVKNFSGAQYIEALNVLDEESIYLNADSEVGVASTGVANTGIENSVRVAFAQLGRVKGTTTDPAVITSIDCAESEGAPSIIGAVTGICRAAQIWEPNDKDHTNNAISWYDTSCVARTGLDVTEPLSYGGACGTVANGIAYPTYAINTAITSADNIDIYDGLEYNTYELTTKLTAYPYFTDTTKLLEGINRPAFTTLSPNSITKVRIYIYIEGQDIDNYDFASIGKAISVKFGFTKQRFKETDIDYDGPSLNPSANTIKPVITLLGAPSVNITQGTAYNDAGVTANDDIDGNITYRVQTINPVDINTLGTYYITYNVSDTAGNYAQQVTRTVTVGS